MRLYEGKDAITMYKMATTEPDYEQWDKCAWEHHAQIVKSILPRTTRAGQILLLDALPFPVHEHIAGDANTPVHILEHYYKHWTDEWVLGSLAENPKTPIHVLEFLASSRSPLVRKRIINNWNTPCYIRRKIIYTSAPTVSFK